jgi:hypothetical protein
MIRTESLRTDERRRMTIASATTIQTRGLQILIEDPQIPTNLPIHIDSKGPAFLIGICQLIFSL